MPDQEWFTVATITTNTIEGSIVDVYVNTEPICPNMTNQQFRALVMRLRDTAVSLVESRITALNNWQPTERARLIAWFGHADDNLRNMLALGLPKLKSALLELKPSNIVRYDDESNRYLSCTPALVSENVDASVCKPDSDKRVIAIYPHFCTLPDIHSSKVSKLKTIIHECTHYIDVFDSDDVMYGSGTGLTIWAKSNPHLTKRNADSITCYIAN
jgi:hypothetical protein